jgi:uracil-DNA glycosylase
MQIGFFNGNKILFVGQNPGMPYTPKTKKETEKIILSNNWRQAEVMYQEMIKSSKIGKFIGKIIKDDWDSISFTNIVKIPTIGNAAPSQKLIDDFKHILKCQIMILEPKLIVCLGKVAGSQFGLTQFETVTFEGESRVTMIPHSSYYRMHGGVEKDLPYLTSFIQSFFK